MYKRGLKLWSVNTDFYYDDAIRLYSLGLYDYIELYVVPDTLDTLFKWKELEKRNGIPFIIHNAHFAQGFNLAKQEKAERNRKIYDQTKQFADELDAKYIIFHGGIDGDIKETASQLASFKEPRALIENKPFVALPNRMGGEFCRGYNKDEIKLVMDTAGCGFCLDFGHAICAANSLGVNVYEYCEQFLNLNPNMFHLTDLDDINSPYDSHLHLGAGQLDFNRIFAMIPDESYVTFETVKNSKKDLNDFTEDMEWLKNIK
ncbi:MAG: TIM barrel protein [Cyanobacteria bacterium RUI128]|nr:TIM barrel protein [Cyanobacteria bacterium RUI128]